MKHIIYSEKKHDPDTFEWRLRPYKTVSGILQGFILEHRRQDTENWTILVDASVPEGDIQLRVEVLRKQGVGVEIT